MRSPRQTSAAEVERILGARRELRWGPDRLGPLLGHPVSTVAAVLRRTRTPRLADIDRPTGILVRRFEACHPGPLLHLGHVPGARRARSRMTYHFSSMYGLVIPERVDLDFLALGGMAMRLDPGIVPFRKAREASIHVSGGEYNVAANLADCFGLRTGIATAMVDYPIGDLVDERIRAIGVRPMYRRFAHDGVGGPNIATVYSDRPVGVRAPIVFYNRADEAAARLAPGDFDWAPIFDRGVRWFHSGGIFAALSPSSSDLIVEAMTAARAAGAVVSFDLNYRGKIWGPRGGLAQAQKVMRRIVEHVDVLVGNEEDLQQGLGIPGPEAATLGLDPSTFLGMIAQVVARYPQVKVVATTLRQAHSTSRHSWSAAAWVNGTSHLAPTMELDVYDRVGGGDGFAAGFFYGLLSGAEPDEALRLGWAHGALVVTYPGDTTMATLAEVKALAHGNSARIQR